MTTLSALLLLLMAVLLPAAVWVGIQIGRDREREGWED